MVLIQADMVENGRYWGHEHSSPVPVIDERVVLNDPPLRKPRVPSVRDLIADARGFSRFEDDHDCTGWSIRNTGHEFVTTALLSRKVYSWQ
jgi:hypothetical protein